MKLDRWPRELRERLVVEVLRLLDRSRAFRRRAMWPWALVVLRDDPAEREVTSRPDFSMWLASNGLHDQAATCSRLKVPPRAVALWIESERPGLVGSGFAVLHLDEELRALRKGAA